jgi:hypothetical protein
MNPNDFASLLSSFGGGGGGAAVASLMQGIHQGRGSTGATTQQGIIPSLLDTFPQQSADSRPNTAPAGTTVTSTSRSGGLSSSATVPTTSSGPKGGPIQMNALSSVLANLGSNASQEIGAAASSKPAVDLYDSITHEVCLTYFYFSILLNY